MNPILKTTALGLLIGAVLLPLSSSAAAFLKLGDIKGESTDTAHKDWINLLSFGLSIDETTEHTSGLPTGKRQHKPFVISKPVDKASPLMLELLAEEKVVPFVRLEYVTDGPRPQYYQVILRNVKVTSFQVSGTGADEVPQESFSLNYEEIKWTYTEFDPEGRGNLDHSHYWNLLTEMGESDQLPAGSFRLSGRRPTSAAIREELRLRWTGFEEFVYKIYVSEDIAGPYRFLEDYEPAQDGDQELVLPANLSRMFYQIEKVPTQ